MTRIPDFLSAWTDEQGRFILYLPEENYYLGGAEEFPPGRKFFINHNISADKDKSGIKIIRKEANKGNWYAEFLYNIDDIL